MREANPTWWGHLLMRTYLNRIFWRDFEDYRVLGVIPSSELQAPLIVTPNHSSWWDGFWCYLLNEAVFRRETYFLMLEEQLRNYPFFRRVGCFAVEPNSPKSIRKVFEYIAALFRASVPRVLFYFPQGELRPDVEGSLILKKGIERLHVPAHTNVLALTFRVEYLSKRKPTVFCLGDVMVEHQRLSAGEISLEQVLNEQRQRLHRLLLAGERGKSLREMR